MRALMRIRNARIYLLGDVVSTLGDSALWLAMAIWVKELTGNSGLAGLVMFCFAFGNLFSPLGGVIADRFRRRPLLIWSNLIAAALVLLIVLVHNRGGIWIIYAVIFVYGVIGSIIGPAQTALLPRIVPEDLLPEANAAQQTLNQGLRIITPLVGSGLFAWLGGASVAIIDSVTFVVAAASLIALRVSEPSPAAKSGTTDEGGKFSAGFRFIRHEPMLRAITIALSLAILVIGFTESAVFSVVTVGLHHRPTFTGVLMTTQGIGAVVGGLTAAAILKRLTEGMMIAVGLACGAVAVLLLTLPSLVAVLIGMFMAGLMAPWVIVAAMTAIQTRTPSEVLGRVAGAFQLGITVPQVTSVGLGAALIAVLSNNYRPLLVVVAVVITISIAFLLSQPEVRNGSASPTGAPTMTAATDEGQGRSTIAP